MDKKWDRLEGVVGVGIKIPKKYKVDFEKVNSFDDLKNIIEIFFEGLNVTIDEDSNSFEHIKDYLIEVK
ncbi:hypothetical protein [Romboutsia timonensis]|uniref:hypothetical protein n=1 Tax=Romboutsia timonensis TaxID=1776391 RepID=UPI002A812414|nr:hypothetical protein [Romboutsia timonensis]MDY3960190.1 hypothetical protein [Romboutsia timonensis]